MAIAQFAEEIDAASARYAEVLGIERTDDWLVLKLHEEVGEFTQAYLARSGRARDRGVDAAEIEASFRAELADVLGHVLLLAHRFDLDLADEVRRKWQLTRSE